MKLSEFMVDHWKNIGFAPTELTLDEDIDTENDVEIKDSVKFTPKKMELSEEEIGRLSKTRIFGKPQNFCALFVI